MTLSIIIPTKDRPVDIQKCIESILKQIRLPDQIIVVDASSTSVTEMLIRDKFEEYKSRFIYIKTKPGLTYQRNIGTQKVTSDLVLFLDDDVILERDYISEVKIIFENDKKYEIIGTTGNIVNVNKLSLLSGIFRKFFFLSELKDGRVKLSGCNNSVASDITRNIEVDWLSGSNMCYRNEIFDWQLFDENLSTYSYMEDVDFSYRASKRGKLFYIPSAKLVHNVSPISRIKIREARKMLICNHTYLFKKNMVHTLNRKISFYLSLVGFMIQSIAFEKSLHALIGTFEGLFESIFLKNYKLPYYDERPNPKRVKAEELKRYQFALPYIRNNRVLDCACGIGIGERLFRDQVKNIYGVDISLESIRVGKRLNRNENSEFICGSAIELPFRNEIFDVVISFETVEHIHKKFHEKLISEFRRVLKTGGIFIVSTPQKEITSPGRIAPKNYFHIGELYSFEFVNLLNKYYQDINIYGEYFGREIKSKEKIDNNISKINLRKILLLITPFWLKDILSLVIKGRHIYLSEDEVRISKDNIDSAIHLIGICKKL